MRTRTKYVVLIGLIASWLVFDWLGTSLLVGSGQCIFGVCIFNLMGLQQTQANLGSIEVWGSNLMLVSWVFALLAVGCVAVWLLGMFGTPRKLTPAEKRELKQLKARVAKLEGRTNPVTSWYERFRKHNEPTEKVGRN